MRRWLDLRSEVDPRPSTLEQPRRKDTRAKKKRQGSHNCTNYNSYCVIMSVHLLLTNEKVWLSASQLPTLLPVPDPGTPTSYAGINTEIPTRYLNKKFQSTRRRSSCSFSQSEREPRKIPERGRSADPHK